MGGCPVSGGCARALWDAGSISGMDPGQSARGANGGLRSPQVLQETQLGELTAALATGSPRELT